MTLWNARNQPGPRVSRASQRTVLVRDDTVRRRPAYAEELREDGAAGPDQTRLVGGVSAALIAHQEAGPADHGLRPGIETGRDVGDVGDASGRENGIAVSHRTTNARQQLHRGQRPANVATGLDALSNHAVRPGRACRECLLDRATLVHPDLGGPPPRGAPKGDDHVGLRSRLEVPAARERQEQVHRQRPIAQPAGRRDLSSQPTGIKHADRAQATGRRDRRGEPMPRKATAHATLHNRHLHSQPLQQGTHALIIAASVLRSRQAERSATAFALGAEPSPGGRAPVHTRETRPSRRRAPARPLRGECRRANTTASGARTSSQAGVSKTPLEMTAVLVTGLGITCPVDARCRSRSERC